MIDLSFSEGTNFLRQHKTNKEEDVFYFYKNIIKFFNSLSFFFKQLVEVESSLFSLKKTYRSVDSSNFFIFNQINNNLFYIAKLKNLINALLDS